MEKTSSVEIEKFSFNWHKWQEMKVENVVGAEKKNTCWLTLYYNPDYPSEVLDKLKVKAGMPFEVMLKMNDVNVEDLQGIFHPVKESKESKIPSTGIRLKNQIASADRNIQAHFFQESLEKIMSAANLSFFWHGWASDSQVWHAQQEKERLLKENIEQRSVPGKPIVNIIPNGLGIKGGCQSREEKNKRIFTPQMYGKQMAEFIHLFGWDKDKTYDIFGHSMGGAGALWLALEIVNNPRFRITADEIPDLRFWLLAPAYPKEANIFIRRYLDACLRLLNNIPAQSRPAGRPITKFIIDRLLPLCTEELKAIQTRVVIENPETIIETMAGLAEQEYFTLEQWQGIISRFPIMIYTTTQDRLVDEELSNRAFHELTAQVKEHWPDTAIIEPLILSGKGDHYLDAMAVGKEEVLKTSLEETISLMAAPRLLPYLYDKIPRSILPEVINILAATLDGIKRDDPLIRRNKIGLTIKTIVEKIKAKAELTENEEGILKLLLAEAFKYYKLLWEEQKPSG